MVTLTENSLGKRQRELNIKVNEAAANKIDFEEAKAQSDVSDVDKLYLIDLASKYKNIDYILDVLKGGDSLHISRAVKCAWLYEDQFSNIINTDYLDHNIFPLMSFKMKRKFLTSISMHITNEHRASDFYTYCWNVKLHNIALKFLIFTSESFKLAAIKSSDTLVKISNEEGDYLQFLIGNSSTLAGKYLEELKDFQRSHALYKLRYLMSVSNKEYLDLLEKYEDTRINTRFGLRTSKHILKNHKHRVLQNPSIYVNILNKNMLIKLLTVVETKKCAVKLLPESVSDFWSTKYCTAYEFILEIIPEVERFQFLKKIFNEKYPNEEFEMTKIFFESQCYKFMTLEERHNWALQHVESKKEIQGVGCDYLWYKFVNFDISFSEIKKYIMTTPDFRKRGQIIKVLIHSARTQREIEKLLTYYYSRHINESKNTKEAFLTELIEHHNIFDFDNDCWIAFDKILHDIEVYNNLEYSDGNITFVALVYHIFHKIDIPEALIEYIDSGIKWYWIKDILNSKLNEEKQEIVYKFLHQYYLDKIIKLDGGDISDDTVKKIENYIHHILQLLDNQKGKTINDCPEVIMKYVNLNRDSFNHYHIFPDLVTEEHMLRYLKQDMTMAIDKIPDVRDTIIRDNLFRINNFLKKLKIYFPHDLAKEYLNCFVKMLSGNLPRWNTFTVVYGILQLADEQFKTDFLMKYAPTEAKIDRKKIDTQLLYIQEGICSLACLSRPPVPLSNMLMYIKGDYIKYCLPMFNSYLQNLPLPQCLMFAKTIIDAPISLQKHGIRLAFECFNTENLKQLITDIWKKTKNVSLRFIIYRELYKKVSGEAKVTQHELFQTLKSFTLDLNEDDQDEFYDLLTSNTLPSSILSEYIEFGWKAVKKLSDKTVNVRRKTVVIQNIKYKIDKLDVKFLQPIIDEHIQNQLVEAQIQSNYQVSELKNLYAAKWKLVATYLVYFTSDKECLERNIQQATYIIKRCMEMWDVLHDDTYTYRQFCWEFLDDLASQYKYNGNYEDSVPILEAVLTVLQESLPLRVIYLKLWSLRLSILNKKSKQAGKQKICKEETVDGKIKILKETIISFVNEAGNLIKESVEKSIYFSTYSGNLRQMLLNNIIDIKDFADDQELPDIDSDLFVGAAASLTEIGLPETYLLAVYLLPQNSERHWNDDFEVVVNKIKNFNNEEVRFRLYEKFINSDFKRKKFSL